MPLYPTVQAANIAVYPEANFGLSLEVEEGGDFTTSPEQTIDLSLDLALTRETVSPEQTIDLDLVVGSDEYMHATYPGATFDLSLGFSRGDPYNIVWVWDPYDQPKLTGKNYTYNCYVGLLGTPAELHIVIRFEGSIVTEKDSNATGQFVFWAVVGSPGVKTWSFTLYDDGEEVGLIWKDTEYAEGGPGPVVDPPPGPGPDIPDLPTAPGSLFGVFDALPLMVVFGIFGFIGNLIVGRVGVLFGAVAALFLTTAMGTLPSWVLYFVILVTIIVVAYKLKTGGSNVTVNNGGVSA